MKHRGLDEVYCSVARTWSVLGDRWTMLILREAFRGTSRFDTFQARLEVGRTLLSDRLGRLVEEGVFERALYRERPERYEYKLTPKGLDLYPVLLSLMEWGDRYKVEDPPVKLIHKACGEEAEPHLVCSHCSEPVGYFDLRAEYAPERVVVVTGGTVADVYTGRWIAANVAIDGGRIVYVGPKQPDGPVIDARGKRVVPGYIEPHSHPWCLYSPASLLEAAVPDGTTTIVYDNLFFYMAHGVAGLRGIVDAMNTAPAHVKWVARIAPQSAYAKDAFDTAEVAELLAWPEVVASGEITNWFAVTQGHPRLTAGIAAAKAAGKRVEGHNAGASYDRLNALSAAGISADHEAITGEEALQRLQLGMWTMLRQSSLRPDLEPMLRDLLPVIDASRRLMLTTDGATPAFYARHGMIGGALRVAIEAGVEPMRALQMATIDPATFLGLDEELGGIAPGRRATLNIVGDDFRPEVVLVDGEIVARDGVLTAPLPEIDWPAGPPVRAPQVRYGQTGIVPVMRHESAVINRRADTDVTTLPPGHVHAALVARDGTWITRGVIAGLFGELPGFATTLTTSLDLLVLGRDPAAMARAAARVAELGGGIAFDGGWSAPLAIDGLIHAGSFAETVALEQELDRHARAAGYPFHDVVYSLLFASGDFLPELRLTPRGLLDVKSRTVLEPAQRLG